MDTVLSADAVSQEEAMQCWDDGAEEFAGRFKRNEEFFHKHVINPTLLDLLGDVKGKAALDLACGEGHFSRKLAEQAKGDIQITGIDASKKLIDIAQKKNDPFHIVFGFCLAMRAAWTSYRRILLTSLSVTWPSCLSSDTRKRSKRSPAS